MKKISFFALLFFLETMPFCFAQQTIFNVPSADVAVKEKSFIQHESQINAKGNENFWNTTEYFAKGIGYNTEIDATLFNLNSPASDNVALGLGFKSSFPIKIKSISDYQPKIIFGSMLPVSLQGNGSGYWIYSSGSVTLPRSDTRLSAGISSGTKQIFGENATCFIGGFEQKITNKISFINDWYSGNHAWGMFSTGFSYSLPQDFVFFGGYQIPNSKKVGQNAIIAELAKSF